MTDIAKEMLRLKEINKIDGVIGAKNVGMVLDSFNSNIDIIKEKQTQKELNDRNLYYWKLWQRAIEEIRRGERPKEKSKPIIYSVPNMTVPHILTADGKEYVGKQKKEV